MPGAVEPPDVPPVRYVFLFAPNNSGTTVMCQYLADQTGGYLPPFGNNEGQMAPALKRLMRVRPWDASNRFDWPAIHAQWDRLCRRAGQGLFIEGSPPNLLRVEDIRREFDGRAQYLCALSSPYMQVASCLYNYHKPGGDGLTTQVKSLARQWLVKARALRATLKAHEDIKLVRYEDFCADPGLLNAALGLERRAQGAIRGKWTSGDTRIRDATARNLGFLRTQEIDRISAVLARAPAVLRFFGYELTGGQACLARLSAQEELFAQGVERRARWDRHGGRVARDVAGDDPGSG